MEGRKGISYIRKQRKVKCTLMTIRKNKWTWAGHIMHRTGNQWTLKSSEFQTPELLKSRSTGNQVEGKRLEHLSESDGLMVDNDDDDYDDGDDANNNDDDEFNSMEHCRIPVGVGLADEKDPGLTY